MSERKKDNNFALLREEVKANANNKEVKSFIGQANEPKVVKKAIKRELKLITEGVLKENTTKHLERLNIFFKKEHMHWIECNVVLGKGGRQVALNYIIGRGIEAIDKEYDLVKSPIRYVEE